MSRTESTFSQRIGARISPELKASLQTLVDDGLFESEADTVREALWQFVEQTNGQPRPKTVTSPPGRELQRFEEHTEWLFSVLLILLAMVGSRILQAVGAENIKPAALVDEAIQETIYNQALLHDRLQVGQAMAHQNQPESMDAEG
jgi:Arc/MetJ-type ribon-helix-helix transcriptional regulator